MTHSLLSPLVELTKNKTRYFQKLQNEFLCNIARLNDMKGWKSLVSLREMFYASPRLSINIVKKHAAYTCLFHLNDYRIQTMKKDKYERASEYKPPNLIPINLLSTDHEIQILKKWKCKRSPHFRFLRCNVIILRAVYSSSLFFFLRYGKTYNYF